MERLQTSELIHLESLLKEHKRSTAAALDHIHALKKNKAPAEAFRLVAEAEEVLEKVDAYRRHLKSSYDIRHSER